MRVTDKRIYLSFIFSILLNFFFLSFLSIYPFSPKKTDGGRGKLITVNDIWNIASVDFSHASRTVTPGELRSAITSQKEVDVKPFSHQKSTSATNEEYWSPEAVTSLAMPVGEWFLDIENWEPGTRRTIELKIWISKTGSIVSWKILNDAAQDFLVLDALKELPRTIVNPAKIGETPVASYRFLEIEVFRHE